MMAASAVLYVKHLPLMRAFYERSFTMSSPQADDGFCLLVGADWELSLVCVAPAIAATIVIADPPQRRAASPVKLVFDVADLDEVGARVISAGGQMDPVAAVWEFRGRRHRDCLDPEGNVVQLRQRAPTPASVS